MNKKSMYLVSLIRKLIREYEKTHDKLFFSFEKKKDYFIYTDINEKFLEELKLKKTDIIGQSLYDIKNLVGNYFDWMIHNYEKAWEGYPIFYYVTFSSNPEKFFVISLDPIMNENGCVYRVDGHCVPLDKNEVNELQSGLSLFSEHESIVIHKKN